MSTPQILVIGAGALGLTSAYHLQLAGAEISFLVRSHRVENLSRPQHLYRCNDHSLKTFEGFHVFTDTSELEDKHFDFVLLTLDGATCRSEQGIATLQALGNALAGTNAKLMINGVGIGLYEHVRECTGLTDAHLLQGTMGILAYQVGQEGTPHPDHLNEKLYNKADIAYVDYPDGIDFLVANKPKAAAKAFVELFNRCGVASCKAMPDKLYKMFTSSFFPFSVACELNHWQSTEALIANTELWHLCCQSRREIMQLKRFGLLGKIFSWLMSDKQQAKMMRKSDNDSAAMGYMAFTKFHHGGKVQAQALQVLENCIAEGDTNGQALPATRSLLDKSQQHS